ncbi:HTH domain-containing protein [Haloterrigena salifodinae]|uniref:HTH domain-containing protein n=1 Tax=Haloterrigena salifodinae TaxID=2675099 RepID=UPI000F878AF9|nr:HTH domain-containing protein [Haloterrigena salifodinae]
MTPDTQSTEITAVCHVRAPLLLEPVDRQVETLRACESEGAVDDLLLRSWPKEVTLTDDTPYQEALESVERFDGWADRQGVSIRPPFRERTATNQISGETTDVLIMPMLCLELYADDELVGVFPHTDENADETYTTDEAIAALRTGELPTPLGGEPEETAAADSGTDGCPDCGASLIDGQGLFACPECGWLGTVTETGQLVAREEASRTTEHETAAAKSQ